MIIVAIKQQHRPLFTLSQQISRSTIRDTNTHTSKHKRTDTTTSSNTSSMCEHSFAQVSFL